MAPVRRGLQDFCELAGESGRARFPTRLGCDGFVRLCPEASPRLFRQRRSFVGHQRREARRTTPRLGSDRPAGEQIAAHLLPQECGGKPWPACGLCVAPPRPGPIHRPTNRRSLRRSPAVCFPVGGVGPRTNWRGSISTAGGGARSSKPKSIGLPAVRERGWGRPDDANRHSGVGLNLVRVAGD